MFEELKKLGLSNKEAEIYLVLAKLGESSANELSKKNSTNRTVTYNILEKLIEKGLVSFVNKSNNRVYTIAKPESLLSSIKEKEILALSLIDKIKKLKQEKKQINRVEIYEGLESVKSIFDEIKKAKELRILNATGKIFEKLIYSAHHVAKDIALRPNLKTIAVQSMKNTSLFKLTKPSTVKYLPKEAENYATTFIFDNKVVIQILKDNPFIIRIENKDLYDGYKKDFDVLWSKL